MPDWAFGGEGMLAGLAVPLRAASVELLLFAAVFILLFGLGDLLIDAVWLGNRTMRAPTREVARGGALVHRLAIFIPAWHEAEVIGRTLAHARAAWRGDPHRIYVGCYTNDAPTLLRVAAMAAVDPNIRIVLHRVEGPTTKADCLNAIWRALRADERAEGDRCDAVILHDAEDYVDPGELAAFDRALCDYAFVQLPVIPLIPDRGAWIAGHYCDEFAEAHQKDIIVRHRIGASIPAAGTGCAFRRDALDMLGWGGDPFRADSLVEDYEIGLAIGQAGLASTFLRVRGVDGSLIAVRSHFPDGLEASIRQKARWIAGIALSGWDRIGWVRGRSPRQLACNWMLWRDRRAPLAAIVTLAAYLGAVLIVLSEAAAEIAGIDLAPLPPLLGPLLGATMVLLVWRLAMRFVCTARLYGRAQGLRAVPRAFVSNVIAVVAAHRAVSHYIGALCGGQLRWDKTTHVSSDVPLRVERGRS